MSIHTELREGQKAEWYPPTIRSSAKLPSMKLVGQIRGAIFEVEKTHPEGFRDGDVRDFLAQYDVNVPSTPLRSAIFWLGYRFIPGTVSPQARGFKGRWRIDPDQVPESAPPAAIFRPLYAESSAPEPTPEPEPEPLEISVGGEDFVEVSRPEEPDSHGEDVDDDVAELLLREAEADRKVAEQDRAEAEALLRDAEAERDEWKALYDKAIGQTDAYLSIIHDLRKRQDESWVVEIHSLEDDDGHVFDALKVLEAAGLEYELRVWRKAMKESKHE